MNILCITYLLKNIEHNAGITKQAYIKETMKDQLFGK